MFTVMQRSGNGETLFRAKSVTHLRKGSDDKPTLLLSGPDSDEINQLSSGLCFVMNEAGATVARYDLGNL